MTRTEPLATVRHPSSGAEQDAAELVAHSVLAADRLAAEVASRYHFTAPPRCQLLFRGMNDVYVVHADEGTRYALRAWRAHWRSLEEVETELAFLNFLRDHDFPAAFPVADRAGGWHFVLEAPEGPRPVALYRWASGVKFSDALSEPTAAEIGRLFASMHRVGTGFVPPHFNDRRWGTLIDDLPWLLELVQDRPGEAKTYAQAAPRLQAALDSLADRDLPQGACHGDLHPANLHIDGRGDITFLDFDESGHGYFVRDIANFVFGTNFYGFDKRYTDAFLTGYDGVRSLTGDERELLPFFVLAKTFQLVAGIARNVNAVGRASLRYRGLDWFASEIEQGWRAHADLLGAWDGPAL